MSGKRIGRKRTRKRAPKKPSRMTPELKQRQKIYDESDGAPWMTDPDVAVRTSGRS